MKSLESIFLQSAISVSNSMIIMDMKRLQQTRMLQFNLSSKEDASDSGMYNNHMQKY